MSLDLSGHTIGDFTLHERIGDGGFATVYRASQAGLGRQVAVKVLDPLLARDPKSARRFEREAIAAAALEHPNILPVYAAGHDGGLVYLAMRLVQGETLQDRLDRVGRLTMPATVSILRQVAAALDHAHGRGLIHRDVKPANILLEAPAPGVADGRVWLADFGIAIAAHGTERSFTEGVGTADYVAPEQARGDPEIDLRADVYSLGCTAYHCIVGEQPLRRATPLATIVAHLNEPVPQGHGAALDAVFASAMAKSPEDRPGSASALVNRLEQAGGSTPAIVPPTDPAPSRARRWLLPTGLATALLIVVGAVVLLGPGNPGEAPTSAAATADPARVAFAQEVDGQLEIVVAGSTSRSTDGTPGDAIARVTDHPAEDRQPTWSPDGARLAFASDRSGSWAIYLTRPTEGATATALTAGEGETEPAWSPDGRRVAAVRTTSSGDRVLVVTDVATREELVLEQAAGQVYRPAFVPPDGTMISYHRLVDGQADLYVIPADGTGAARLLHGVDTADDAHPSWSCDGRTLVFSTARDAAPRIAHAQIGAGLDVGELAFLTTGDLDAFEADVDGPGRSVAYRAEQDGISRVTVASLDGAGQPRDLGPGIEPAFERRCPG